MKKLIILLLFLSSICYARQNATIHQTPNILSGYLVGQWHCNELSWAGTAGEVQDTSITKNHGTGTNGATTTASGRFGYAGNFPTSNDYLKIGSNNAYQLTTASKFTITMWIMRTATVDADDGICSKYDAGGYTWILFINGTYIQFSGYNDAVTKTAFLRYSETNINTVMTINTWYFLAAEYDTTATGNARIFISGTGGMSQIDTTGTAGETSNPDWSTSINVVIGNYCVSNAVEAWKGYIEEVNFWNKALSVTELNALYYGGMIRN